MILDLLPQQRSSTNNQTFKFKTDAQVFKIILEIEDKINGFFPHIGVCAREGIMVLYKNTDGKTWLNVDAYTTRSNTEVNMTHIIDEGEEYEVLIYGPILSKISKLKIELPDTALGQLIDEKDKPSILIAGGMYSFGVGTTTTSMMFSNILGRKMGATIDNISFREKIFLKKTYTYLKNNKNLPKYSIGILEIDNYSQDKRILKKYLKATIKSMKSICDNIICWYSISNYTQEDKENIEKMLENEISSNEIELLDISHIFSQENKDICAYSDKFINDTGNVMIYKQMEQLIAEILMEEILGSL